MNFAAGAFVSMLGRARDPLKEAITQPHIIVLRNCKIPRHIPSAGDFVFAGHHRRAAARGN
jgi:hypothetical protein